jgi:endonuclease-3
MQKKLLSKKSAYEIFKELKLFYGPVKCGLEFNNAYELLIATILSAQCTDKRVNIVTKNLFKKYPDVYSLAQANELELIEVIRPTGFYNNKSKNILRTANKIINDYDGDVPKDINELIKLSGVGRKTASVVLFHAYCINSGIAVDTHVIRLSNRFCFVNTDKQDEIEHILMKLFNKSDWGDVSDYLIAHGRNICLARNPKCSKCFLNNKCCYFKTKF